ncbi:hypothetical protein [Agromyces larvae]|uniref:NTP pyrophosphohydrolase n=1 Tax=Agromyces larvae TaxID=2929802 RepID=A0ABY4BY51_9MICO|nr:hypothetical protein [Agromyces larvae]UOE44168.1 hypothetical protein MTO99_18750 [Agromyces larvae]
MGDGGAIDVEVIVDAANVMGSRPDGWWRDRAAAASRVVAGLPALVGRVVDGPDASPGPVRIARATAVIEGAAKAADLPDDADVLRAPADGDSAIAELAAERASRGIRVLVVTADRGLRARLPDTAIAAGPNWLNALLGR